uniref:Candidate secreted effector n=1 Tax=Meloidogyne incognita TaxID=6306 RepID=A0A914KG99_MELIC
MSLLLLLCWLLRNIGMKHLWLLHWIPSTTNHLLLSLLWSSSSSHYIMRAIKMSTNILLLYTLLYTSTLLLYNISSSSIHNSSHICAKFSFQLHSCIFLRLELSKKI